MANQKIADLTEDAAPARTDLLYKVAADGTTDRKVQVASLLKQTLAADVSGLGSVATHAVGEFDAAGAAAAAQSASQPLDSDLTAIAALSTTAYGRAFLALADAAAGRTALGLGTAATHATGDYDAAGAAAAAQSASQPLDSDLTAIAALTTTSYGRAFLALADAAAGRTALGLGTAAVAATTDFDAAGAASAAQSASQPVDSDLTAIAALSTTSFGRSLLTQADAATARATLGVTGTFGEVTRVLTADYTMAAGSSLVVVDYLDDGGFTLEIPADAVVEVDL